MRRTGANRVPWLLALGALVAACSSSAGDRVPSGDATGVTPSSPPSAPATVDASSPFTETGESLDAPTDAPTTIAPPEATDPVTGPPSSAPASEPGRPEPGSCIENLSVRERAALLVWPAVYAEDWSGAIGTVGATDVGGVLLMGQGSLTADEIRTRLADLEAASRHGLIVATDEEGGDVQRLPSLGELESQRTMSQERSVEEAGDAVAAHGALVRSVGVDMVLGPVVDVEPNIGEVPLQPSRFFVGGPDRVTEFAAAYIDGWTRAGLFSTIKHYPGHGAASGDTHIAAGVTPSLDDLREFDLKPYRDLAAIASGSDTAVMVGHLTVPDLTDGVPATQSRAAVDLLRNELGYADSLLMTDALGMAAVGIPEPDAAVLALVAGIDVVLFTLTSQTRPVIDAIEQAVADGRIDVAHLDGAARKVMSMLERDGHTCNSNR